MRRGERYEAMQNGEKHYFTGKPCKYGHVALRHVKCKSCLECKAVTSQKQREKESADEKEKRLNLSRSWFKQNKHMRAVYEAQYQNAKIKRTPKWLSDDDFWMIKEIYDLASLRTKLFGFLWHVDHIVPIRGKKVSGLHTPENLQVIPWIDNVKKSNKFNEVTYA
jgi:hypothetical protein